MRKSWAVAAAVVVFVSEILAIGSFAVWGGSVTDSWWVPYALLLAGLVVWNQVALRAEAARVVLYALALLAILAAGHPVLGLVQAVVFVAALALARRPEVRELISRARGIGREESAAPTR
jgi:hypothetical protein